MMAMMGARNTSGFKNHVANKCLPPSSHITYEGIFNQLQFNVGPKTNLPVDLHIGYARYQYEKSKYDAKINDYLALFLKSQRDGSQRDDTIMNATICVDISGSMGNGLQVSKNQNKVKESKNLNRLQLSIEAIKMFYSKLRPNDSLGLVIFDTVAELVVKQTIKSQICEQIFFQALNELKPRGGTTISKGFELARDTLQSYIVDNDMRKQKCENRMIMITDVGDNSIAGANDFIKKASQTQIHLTIIGVSSSFKSQTCECLKNIKGFNYFCAINEDDLMKYVFHTFDFGFFPVAHDLEIDISSNNIQKFTVFGSTDSQEVQNYNDGFKEKQTTFTVSRMKSVFPSQISIKNQNIFTIGGLILIKLQKQRYDEPEFKGQITLKYTLPNGKDAKQTYPLDFKIPINEQYLSQQCLGQALEGFIFTSQIKNILDESKGKRSKEDLEKYLPSLQNLLAICPKEKISEVESMIKIVKEAPKTDL